MEGPIQRTSSQAKPLEPNDRLGVEKLKNAKPPLLPKPQLLKLDSKYHKNVCRTSTKALSLHEEEKVKSYSSPSIANGEKVSLKPAISPKPQVPPKTSAGKLENVSSSVGKISNIGLPRAYQKSSSADDSFSAVRNIQSENSVSSNDFVSRQISGSFENSENTNWTITQLIKDSEQLSEFCRQVENCSKHSHILKGELGAQLSPFRRDKDELSSVANPVNLEGLPSNDFGSNEETLIYVNGCGEKENSLPQSKNSDRNLEGSSSDVPKSFLHRYVSSCNQAKEPLKCDEKTSEKNSIVVQSFLYRNKDQPCSKLIKSKSLGQHDSIALDHGDSVKSLPCDLSEENASAANCNRLAKAETLKKSDNSDRLNSSDVVSFSKRFPWFGSFGKGNKKDVKKARCLSQFYAASTTVEGVVLREKNRTKSLPDIKHSRSAVEELKCEQSQESPGILRISSEYPHSDSDDDKDSLNQVELGSEKDSTTLAYLKARELMTSEEVFIDVLKLLNVDFRNHVQLRNFENKNSCIPNGEVDKILNHLSQLQSLNEDILEDLRKRIRNWENHPKIADVIVKKGAFLKMYTTYIQHFESQTNYLDECMVKYPKFGKIVREFEATDRCKKLSLKHYMLKPVQRIPQYRLLLNDYLKHLNESSEDYADTLNALKIVCEVVDHANRNVSHGDKEGRLMHFQSLLSDYELIKPGRELIKDGPLEKICRKTVRDRYFVLLNDCLLHTTYSKQYLKIHQELPLSGMKICYNDDEKYPPSFTVHSITKSFILCAKSETECKEWVETLQKTIEEHIKKQKTFLNVKIEEDSSFKLGKEAPVWVPDGKVTMCQSCTAEFTALFRRHHCRGCGKVVCRNCGSNQAPLQYRNFKSDRVCDQCFDILLKDYEDSEAVICQHLKEILNSTDESAQNEYLSIKARFIKYTSSNSWKKQKYIPPRLKEVSANDSQSVISGWLHRKSRKSWKLFWYVLKDHVLYVYKASEDVLALETIPVLGYQVERSNVIYEDVDKNLVFSLVHPRQMPITFRAESQTAADRWFYALTAAANLDHLTL